ncbi:MAG: DUF1573 domain-containing protein [Candidatus Azobacteroides sp.]|nr:DUF1573 domain-containing protein [Candidatus Azobacteroides sp.]
MRNRIVVCLIILAGLYACSTNEEREYIEELITEWSGKKINFPVGVETLQLTDDETSESTASSDPPYKILIYTDSIGCMSCNLKLSVWKQLMEEADSLLDGKVEFLFYFHAVHKKEIEYLLKTTDFTYPVYLDYENRIHKLNHFPEKMEYRTFLLDKDDKVVLIGNPALNPRIWELYVNTIAGEEKKVTGKVLTTAEVLQQEVVVGEMKSGSQYQADFEIKNTGDEPLVISHVDASCGCTKPEWERRPVASGEKIKIMVTINPDTKGYFRKILYVYGNTEEKIPLVISGVVK